MNTKLLFGIAAALISNLFLEKTSAQTTFTQNTPIVTYANGPGDPFPSTLAVSGLPQYTTKVVVKLNNVNIPNITCNQVYLKSPTGKIVCLFSKSGQAYFTLDGNLIFDQSSANLPPDTFAEPFVPGTYRPKISNAQSLPVGTTDNLVAFNGDNPNGTWSLYENGIIALSDLGVIGSWSLEITASNVLPIYLKSFDVRKQGSSSLLVWQTTKEKNSEQFVIERSIDGKHFEMLDKIKAIGNSDETNEYSYTDRKPIIGSNYYRLRMEDKDGSFENSEIKVVDVSLNGNSAIQVYPNPVKDELVVIFNQISTEEKISLYDLEGIEVFKQSLEQIVGVQKFDIKNLPSKIYILKIGSYTQKIYKL